jgi:hypothetical protein
MQIPQSVFEEGEDPVFPPPPPAPEPDPEADDAKVASRIVLNGMSGTTDQRLVIINHRTFAQGEEGVIKIPGGARVLIKCEAVRGASVEILVRGRLRKELRLPDGR